MSVNVREAAAGDVAAIAEIYNEGIRGRTATFETRERTAADVRHWLGHAEHPLLVAERHGRVVGWIRASAYRARECYAGIAEFSVYVAGDARREGVGDALMAAFIAACARAGAWKLVSRVFPDNAASRALCRRHGFREVGLYEKHARLDGVWRDVVIVERLIEANLT
jgi:phosphinothricin acetyltransferase